MLVVVSGGHVTFVIIIPSSFYLLQKKKMEILSYEIKIVSLGQAKKVPEEDSGSFRTYLP
jgi:hypothetical protein